MSKTLDDLSDVLASVIGGNDENQGVTNWIDTGYEPLNNIMSGDNGLGLPQGRLVEMYGPSSAGKTLLATMMMISAQRMGGVAGFFDHERSFAVQLAKQLGLNDKRGWIYKQPKTWEESNTLMAKAAKAIRDNKIIPADAPILFVFDSIAAALPKSVADKGMDEYTMNDTTALARVTSTTLKTMAAFAEEYNFTVLYLNQIRTKPGVVYGDPTCLRGDVMIPFVDGTSMAIKDVVEQKIDKEVWSFNEVTQSFEPRKIAGWWNNGKLPKGQNWLHIRTSAVDTKNGVVGVTVTADHKFYTREGWVEACDLSVSTELLMKQKTVINGDARSLVLGIIAGDATVRRMGKNRTTAQIVLQDNNDPEYMKWKVDQLTPILGEFKAVPVKWGTDKVGTRYDSPFSSELCDFLPLSRDPLAIFTEQLTPQMLAIWVMDDGYLSEDRVRYTVSVKRRKNDDYLDDLADLLFDKYGLRSRVRSREGALIFDTESSAKIAQMIAPFVPPCMSRKLPSDFQGQYVEQKVAPQPAYVPKWVSVTQIREGSQHRGLNRYDVTVEGNHNYLVGNADNGVLVHNCTPGGGAMEFYASIRIALGRKKLFEEQGGEKVFVGQEITMKATKNKVARPFQECKLRMMYNADGVAYFDVTGSLLDYAIEAKKVAASGARVTWVDGKSYYRKQLIKHINDSGQLKILKGLLAGVDLAELTKPSADLPKTPVPVEELVD